MSRVLTFLLLFLAAMTSAQQNYRGTPFVRNFGKSDYNADTQNWGICQDSRGFIYFANNDGLLSFDGVEWSLTRISASAPLRSILVDSRDRICAGLINDFGIIEREGHKPSSFRSLKYLLPEQFREFDEIWKIHETEAGIVFQCYDYIFLYAGDTIKVIEPSTRFRFSHKVGGRVLVQEPGEGIAELAGDSLVKLPLWEAHSETEINSILDLDNGRMLIGTTYEGLFMFNDGKVTGWNTPVNDMLMKSRLYSAVKLPGNRFAFGTVLNGLVISDNDGNIIYNLNTDWGIQNNTVLSMLADRSGNLWLGLDNGIDFIEINSPLSYISTDKIGTGYCCRVFNGNLYLGTNQGLFAVPFNATSSTTDFQLVKNSAGQVWTLTEAGGQLLCGHNNGTFVISGNTAVRISDMEGAWKFISVNDRPDLLIGGHYKGLALFRKTDGGWKFERRIEGFDESSRYLLQDSNGYIWVGHSGRGIYRLKPDDDYHNVNETVRYVEDKGLTSRTGNILFSFDNRICVSTDEGVFEYDGTANVFKASDELNSLFDRTGRIMSVTTAGNGYTWFIAESESGYLRKNEDMTYTRVTVPLRKLREKFVNEFESVYPYDSDNILMGLEEGFVNYNPSVPKQYNSAFPAYITRVETGKPDSVIYLWDGANDTGFRFPWKNNSFRFHFAAPFFENEKPVLFSWFLEGFSDGWSEWTSEHYKDFTNLHEGQYTLRAKALNVYGSESETAFFSFTVSPPFTRSAISYVLYALIFAALLYGIIRYFLNKAAQAARRKEEELLRELKEQQIRHEQEVLLAEKEIVDLRNEKLQSDMVFRDRELANQTMTIIEKNKLLKTISDELHGIQDYVTNDQAKEKISGLKRKITRAIDIRQQNKIFESYFDAANEDFFRRLKEEYPDLTSYDLRICAFIRMNIPTKEIAAILNISYRGAEVSRYRLRKKMHLSRDVNLSAYLAGF